MTLEAPTIVTAGAAASFTLAYTCGKFGIDDLGALLIAFRSANDQSPLQTADPTGPGYVSAEASNGAVLDVSYHPRRYVRPWFKALLIVAKQFLRGGDVVTVRIGDRRFGSPGLRAQTFCEPRFEFRTLVDPIATGEFALLPVPPVIAIAPGPAVQWKLVLPTQRRPGEPFSLGLKSEDAWGNPAELEAARIRLVPDRDIDGLPEWIELPGGQSSCRVDGLSAGRTGEMRVTALDAGGKALAVSNPVRITDGRWNHYWSDLHGQSEETIGTKSAREYFAFGRDVAFLDVCAHQGNDFQITGTFWRQLNETTAEFNEPGRFVTLPGFEWSGNTGVGGDHNVWYRNEGRPIYRSSRAMIGGDGDEHADCHTAIDLFEALQKEDVLVVAHCGGRYADVKYAHNARVEPSIEVHSCWGTFEWLLRDAFEAGYRVGIVAGSDDHKGRPGAAHPGASKFGSYGGLTCHLMSELTRDALFDSFRRRHHYATTGARIWVGVEAELAGPAQLLAADAVHRASEAETVRRATMGDIVAVDDDVFRFHAEVLGTAPIERIEIRDGVDVLETVRPYSAAVLGRRVRVVWEGAETRGRGRNAVWDGSAVIEGNRIEAHRAINFWNAERPLTRLGESRLSWSSFTTGGFSGFDVWLASRDLGVLRITTPALAFDVPIADIGLDDIVHCAGGLDKRIRIFRLPDENPHRSLNISRSLELRSNGDTRPYICVTQEDGHRAWSSPLYLFRRARPDRPSHHPSTCRKSSA